ncbi:hypothetical protein BGW36DRAFT_423268 [Talaromyces proteolyticus]|uniref:FAD/NAD(P)-binding domain-containing protein n=1 Tax=Talaromyces proteolyticus TaxID=1131652 RepID=A0AAD4KZZ6_9EURO|nr:uncharacterized protein BGW36DRAFT_423268 [Talaromyces proteolyticus]KAH8703718.1 hypothetical protein BGW36DRAFT_423268 [Talaromyces proteolyticus]
MSNKIVIIGAGFAGVWSALSAKRLIGLSQNERHIEVIVVAPGASLVLRPRLYESKPSKMAYPLKALFEAAGITFFQGTVTSIDTERHGIQVKSAKGVQSTIVYDRLILAAGSTIVKPKGIIGIEENTFNIDSLDAAVTLQDHLEKLASLPATTSRDTVVVCGAGFTGIETASELPKRLGHIPNHRIILIEKTGRIGPELSPCYRPVITQALQELGIDIKLGSAVKSVDANGVNFESGERIETKTTIWTVGVRATHLTQQIPGDKDAFSRLHVNRDLRVPSVNHVFATGDAACVLADDSGHHAQMSCQHALQLGCVSGHNAAADLLGEPTLNYSQPIYNCCLDLGAWGAVVGGGWEGQVKVTGDWAKRVKEYINQKLIYPPTDVQEALKWAKAVRPDSDYSLDQVIQAMA